MRRGFGVARKDGARKEFAVLIFVKPRAFEIEQRNAGEVRERERIDRELREWFVGRRVRFVIEDVDRSVAYLHEIDVAGDDALLAGQFRNERDPPSRLDRGDVFLAKPDRNLDRNRD